MSTGSIDYRSQGSFASNGSVVILSNQDSLSCHSEGTHGSEQNETSQDVSPSPEIPSLALSKRVRRLQKWWATQSAQKLQELFFFIDSQKTDWIEEITQSSHQMIKKETTIKKQDSSMSTFSVYVTQDKLKNCRLYLNLGDSFSLGSGSFKRIYKTFDVETFEITALSKASHEKAYPKMMYFESLFMQLFPNQKTLIQASHVENIGNKQYMLMPFCELGNLWEYEKRCGCLTSKERTQIALDVLEAVEILHTDNIVHRDIKPGNILLYTDEDGEVRAKLADLGLAEVLVSKKTVFRGTLEYLSPELASYITERKVEELIDCDLLKSGDSFGVGISLYHVFFGEKSNGKRVHPFISTYKEHLSNKDLLMENLTTVYRKEFRSPKTTLQKVIYGLSHPNPNQRLSISEALIMMRSDQ